MCTGVRFTDIDNNLFFGRNLDVPASYGQKVMVTPRNFDIPMKHIDDIKTSKAIIGMGIVSNNYPLYFDAANENGLGVINLNFPTHKINNKIEKDLEFFYYSYELVENKINITSYEFITWILENFDKVEDIKNYNLSNKINFIDTPLNEQIGTKPAHWLITDNEQSIVVEPMRDGIKVYDNPVGVVTNDPTFDWHLMNLNQYLGINYNDKEPIIWGNKQLHALGVGSGSLGMPGDWTPASRFVKVAYINNFYPTQDCEEKNVSRLFNTLKSVAMPEGCVNDGISVYSSCYSTKTKTYYYDRHDHFQIFSHTMTDETINAKDITIFN